MFDVRLSRAEQAEEVHDRVGEAGLL